MYIREAIRTPVTKTCDVLVCGGGFAGISAALAAARMQKKVILLEKQCILGGLGTAGLVTIYLPLCDGFGRQVSFGIAEELLRLSLSMGAEALYPANWLDHNDPARRTEKDPRFEVQFNPHLFALLAEELLLREGVEILYGTYAVGVELHGNKIASVITESSSGREGIAVTSVVDATGDCRIAHLADAPTETTREGNLLAAWYYRLSSEGYGLTILNPGHTAKEGDTAFRRFTGLENGEINEFLRLSHHAVLQDVRQKRENDPALFPVTMATMPQLRMTRKLTGAYTLHDREMHTYFEDSIGMVSDWRKRGPVYEVPFRTLYTPAVRNLAVAGRCTSVTEEMWDIMRVIPCCAVTGEAAGTAAAMTDDLPALEIQRLQTALTTKGVILHEGDL